MTVTYVLLVMRADNDGEGAIIALITLLRRKHMAGGRRTKAFLAALGIFGASLFLGDSMITPAISVLSSVEGLKVALPRDGGDGHRLAGGRDRRVLRRPPGGAARYLPRLRGHHTSAQAIGQIYVPLVNWCCSSPC